MSMIQVAVFAILSAVMHFVLLKAFLQRIPAWVSVLLGAALSVAAYQLWVYIDLGFIEPFFQVAAAIQFGLALLIGVATALVFRFRKPAQGEGQGAARP